MRTRMGLGLAVLFLAGCGGGSNPGGAYAACERAVETELVSPGSAEFSGATGSEIEEVSEGLYAIRGYVDSENSFGASLRTDFTCRVAEDGDDWDLRRINVG